LAAVAVALADELPMASEIPGSLIDLGDGSSPTAQGKIGIGDAANDDG
jgi:hypothetical protein